MTNDIFRTVRELLENRDCVLMGNAVNTEGKLYDDSVENLTAILALKDSYVDMLDALIKARMWVGQYNNMPGHDAASVAMCNVIDKAITKAKGN